MDKTHRIKKLTQNQKIETRLYGPICKEENYSFKKKSVL